MERTDIVQVMDKWLDNRMDNVHTSIPGKIVRYYGHKTRTAKVQPLIKIRNTHNKLIKIQPIDNVPVIFPSSSDFNLLFPLKKNDGADLHFSESSIGNFLSSSGEVVDADDLRRFDLSDCIAIPGLWSSNTVPTAPENDNDLFMSFQNALIQIKDKDNDITVKNSAGEISIDKLGKITAENSAADIEISQTGSITIKNAIGKIEINPAGIITFSGGTESFVKGTLLVTQLIAFLTPISTITPGTVVQNAAALTTIKAAAIALLAVINNVKSTDIFGK